MVSLGRIRILELVEPGFFGGVLNHNVTVVERGPSGGLMMIDTSLPMNLERMELYLKAWGYSLEDVSDVVVTHWHHDHAGNASELRKLGARVYAHEDEVEYLANPPRYEIVYSDVKDELKVSEEEFKSTMERIDQLRYDPVTVDVPLKGGEILSGFRVIYVPGHTKGHIALFDGDYLVTGDAVRGVGKLTPPLRFFSWNYSRALTSFQMLTSLPYSVIIPYHGEVFTKW
ncbi:Hydroxyacylglutathione hydrolase [Metallosphaera sp. J1]|uniref:MBL fold metallo-hydrolase n=1 Tax=Metallosphaera javensis (ex Hofmann et al. 2022) TaxID=99938 RepID=UPI001EDD2B99|nr:MBL fold metallo-hydrolase [Metallosphaera javensis (ex Hofmann et al. 2022)]MCG3109947.1 Hydroxyacylglutathione hydrolase [Metallosphaera javensis (ex Hofmann et al. 2022)]